MKAFTAYIPTRLLFGAGKLKELHLQKMPGKRALLVLSRGKSAKESGALKRTEEELAAADVSYALFDEIEANPLKDTVMRGAACARREGCDFILALGGGSVMDASKAIAAMATNAGDVWDYISGGTGKGKTLEKDPLPLIAVTTTAGTGSEVDAWGVISNPETNEKIGFGGDDRLFPVLALVDPQLMLTVPPQYTAYQGFDALFHSTEVHIGKFSNGVSDMFTKAAIEGDSRIPASCCCRRERLGSALESGVRQYDERLCDGGGFDDERALFGARHERVPSRASARRGADHDFQGLLRAFCREARLRRANDRNGAADGAQGCGQGGGFRRGVGGAAKGVRRGRAENVRLRHSPRRVRKDGD